MDAREPDAQDVRASEGGERAHAHLGALVACSPDAIVAVDRDLRVTDWNAAAERLYGYPAQEALGRPIRSLVPADFRAQHDAAVRAVLERGGMQRYETVRGREGGRRVAVAVSLSPMHGPGGEIVGLVAVLRDITARLAAERRARVLAGAGPALASTLELEELARTIAGLLVPEIGDLCLIDRVDEDGARERLVTLHRDPDKQELMNDSWERFERHEPARKRLLDAALEGGRPVLLAAVPDAVAHASAVDPEHARLMLSVGVRSLILAPLPGRERTLGVLTVGVTGSDRRLDEQDRVLVGELAARAGQALDNARLYAAARAAQERFSAAFEHSPLGIAVVSMRADDGGRILQANQALCAMTGHPLRRLARMALADLAHPDDRPYAAAALAELRGGGSSPLEAELRVVCADGRTIWARVTAGLVRDAAGAPEMAVAQVQDVTERRRQEQQLRHLADHDALTGLLNRRRLHDELQRTLARARRYGEPAALLLVDLDNFKYLNDTFGHAAGDRVLLSVADALRARVRASDVVARLGGDEFALILARARVEEAESVARDLRGAIAGASATIGDATLRVTASIGVQPIDPRAAQSADELLADADVAMYDAKRAGRDRVAVAARDGARRQRLRTRLLWSERIRAALEHDGFELWEQPIMSLAEDRVEGAELLVRMRDDDGEVVAPGEFLGVAEQFGQIQGIDRWVIARAVELLAARQTLGWTGTLEVNLSGASMTDEDLMDHIARELEAGIVIDPTRLMFEVTETVAISNIERARRFACRLADLGCRFALDDFGSGFGSFYYLKHLPFDAIKIDGDFVANLPASRSDRLTVQAIVQIAHGLGKQTIAEYVQDAETVAALKSLGVDHAQGYHIGRPRAAELVAF